MTDGSVVLRPLCPSDDLMLTSFFGSLTATDRKHFHPHPFTAEDASRITQHTGKDLYVGMFIDKTLVSYGLLRGWDEGYEVPSLGIAISSSFRGQGLGHLMMEYLHTSARLRGARTIRLSVYANNQPALRLYCSLGYEFTSDDSGNQLVGTLKL